MNVMIGIDPHKGSHTAVAIDTAEVIVDELQVTASTSQTTELLRLFSEAFFFFFKVNNVLQGCQMFNKSWWPNLTTSHGQVGQFLPLPAIFQLNFAK